MIKKNISLFKLSHLLATGFGSGLFPYVPGTIGSLCAIFLWHFMLLFSYKLYLFILAIIIPIGICCCHKTEKDICIHDPNFIVLDEFIGMWISLINIQVSDWWNITISFLLFRLLDIYKPWPIRILDKKIKGGFGIILDDIAAGLSVFCILYVYNLY